MSELKMEFHTPLPGRALETGRAAELLKELRTRFRPVSSAAMASNIPTACLLHGRHDPTYLRREPFTSHTRILLLLEGSTCVQETTPAELVQYLNSREPWEDYDFCVTDETFTWCVGITHNDSIVIVDPNDRWRIVARDSSSQGFLMHMVMATCISCAAPMLDVVLGTRFWFHGHS